MRNHPEEAPHARDAQDAAKLTAAVALTVIWLLFSVGIVSLMISNHSRHRPVTIANWVTIVGCVTFAIFLIVIWRRRLSNRRSRQTVKRRPNGL